MPTTTTKLLAFRVGTADLARASIWLEFNPPVPCINENDNLPMQIPIATDNLPVDRETMLAWLVAAAGCEIEVDVTADDTGRIAGLAFRSG